MADETGMIHVDNAHTQLVLDLQPLMEKIGHRFRDPQLLQLALTHKSFRNEQPGARDAGQQPTGARDAGQIPTPTPTLAPRGDNERLEFLGDAVLDLALSDLLMTRFALDQEGSLSRKRASLVNEEQLAGLAVEVGLVEYLRLGKGERQSGGLSKPRILASTLEAIFGAVFVDAGYAVAAEVIALLYAPLVLMFEKDGTADFARDYKTRLQELAQERFRLTPTYHLDAHSGPDHARTFEVSVRLETRILGVGSGRNKKTAEQDAARRALDELTIEKMEQDSD